MEELTNSRIASAKNIDSEKLINCIKSFDSKRYDQVLIESEERKTYYFLKYKALSYKRTPKILKFPLHNNLVDDFERTIKQNGNIQILEDDILINKLKQSGIEPIENIKHKGDHFYDLELITNNGVVNQNQPKYYLPNETKRFNCNTCHGEKYVTCKEPECRGQHIYNCDECRSSGKVDCTECRGLGEVTCPSCKGRGELDCKHCGGSGEDRSSEFKGKKCKICNGRGKFKCSNSITQSGLWGAAINAGVGKDKCGGSGKVRCKTCNGSGELTCNKCHGDGKVECQVCYSDNIDNRYGKVDCPTCEAAGELASISFIETGISIHNKELLYTDSNEIDAPDFNLDLIKKYLKGSILLELTYKNLNNNKYENYDIYSQNLEKFAIYNIGISKQSYPKIVIEELFYEGIPCITFEYRHILSGQNHKVSVLSIDDEKNVLYHSNPTSVETEKEKPTDKIKEYLRKAFSTKSHINKVDKKNEFLLLVHMAKSDGIIETEEKKYLSKTITNLDRFTKDEKAELFSLMSQSKLPPLNPQKIYFSSQEKANKVRKKLEEIIAKADGEFEESEKLKLEEINKVIDKGMSLKPNAFKSFIKTWQVSTPLIFIVLVIFGGIIYYTFTEHFVRNNLTTYFTSNENIVKDETIKSKNAIEANSSDSQPMNTYENQPIKKEVLLNESKKNDIRSKEDGNISNTIYFKINDPDGYTNLRDKPNGEIVSKIYDSDRFEVLDSTGAWWKIRTKNNNEGFMHSSRITPSKQDKNTSNTIYFKINDPDGYTNLRNKPNGEIISKIYNSDRFEVLDSIGAWWKIRTKNNGEGFMHSSRIIPEK